MKSALLTPTVRLFVNLTLAAFLPVAAARESQEEVSSDKAPSGRLAWFIQTSIPDDMANPVKVISDKETQMLTMSNDMSSGPVKVPSDGVVRLVKELPKVDGMTIPAYRTLAQAVVPKEVQKALVIMSPAPGRTPDGPVFATKVLSLADFHGGDFLYLNLTSSTIGVEVGKHKFSLKPGSIKIQDVTEIDVLGSVPYRYSYLDEKTTQWMPLNASMTITTPTRREVLIFSVSEDGESIRCNSITVPVM